ASALILMNYILGESQISSRLAQELRGQVSAAMLFATARFNTWVAANNFKDGNEMRDAKDQVMSYLLQQFQMMLEDNFDEYCEQFDNYLRFRKNEDFHTHKHDH
ncbi:DUF3144 domain-containing protein, partial [Acinetobacter baumannii]|uniref:DUF3144 domain-containing protein n=1 Tax=Acinetobacter baumannii TaxID=470 RepID=UPI0037C9C9BD